MSEPVLAYRWRVFLERPTEETEVAFMERFETSEAASHARGVWPDRVTGVEPKDDL
jgi:hypothetical protein